MAVTTINSGLVDTADPATNELKFDMRERLVAHVKSGYMLETLSIPRYSPTGSDNASGADNQQERLVKLKGKNPQRLYA